MTAHSRGTTNSCQTSNRFNKGSLGILSIIKQVSINGALFVLSQTVGSTARQPLKRQVAKKGKATPYQFQGRCKTPVTKSTLLQLWLGLDYVNPWWQTSHVGWIEGKILGTFRKANNVKYHVLSRGAIPFWLCVVTKQQNTKV